MMWGELMGNTMAKAAIAVVFIVLTGGAWLYLDCLNKQEEATSNQMQQEMQQMRIEGKKKEESTKKLAAAKLALETQIANNLVGCQENADKVNNAYMLIVQKTLPRKRGQVVVPAVIATETAQVLADAKTRCQLSHDELLQKMQLVN